MELKDTVDLMLSKSYKDRFKAEYYQLKNRYDKLQALIVKDEAGLDIGEPGSYLDFTPATPLNVLMRQATAMRNYLYCLEKRAVFEHIEL